MKRTFIQTSEQGYQSPASIQLFTSNTNKVIHHILNLLSNHYMTFVSKPKGIDGKLQIENRPNDKLF